jgi:hypothetical protein
MTGATKKMGSELAVRHVNIPGIRERLEEVIPSRRP